MQTEPLDPDTHLHIFVPAAQTHILAGSAIVGTGKLLHDRYLVHYEGNRFGSEQLATFENRLQIAASRLAARYPTTATAALLPGDLISVGTARRLPETETWVIESLEAESILKDWLGDEPLPPINGSQELRWRMAAKLYKSMSHTKLSQLFAIASSQQRSLWDVLYEKTYLKI